VFWIGPFGAPAGGTGGTVNAKNGGGGGPYTGGSWTTGSMP
jgi:hypothetical protein